MQRIDTPTADSGKFVDGNASQGKKGTQVSAKWLNDVQEELCSAITAASLSLDGASQKQLLSAIRTLSKPTYTTINVSKALKNDAITKSTTILPSILVASQGNLFDVEVSLNVFTTSADALFVYLLGDHSNVVLFDTSIKGRQTKRFTIKLTENYNGFFVSYEMKDAIAGLIANLEINGFVNLSSN